MGYERAIYNANTSGPLLIYRTFSNPTQPVTGLPDVAPVSQLKDFVDGDPYPTAYVNHVFTYAADYGGNNGIDASALLTGNPLSNTFSCATTGTPYTHGLQAQRSGHRNTASTVNPLGLGGQLGSEPYELAQNRPNPFTAETRIGYRLPTEVRQAHLFVRDLTGRLVRTHALDLRAEETTLQLRALPAGVYTYQLVADGAVRATRRLVLLTGL